MSATRRIDPAEYPICVSEILPTETGEPLIDGYALALSGTSELQIVPVKRMQNSD